MSTFSTATERKNTNGTPSVQEAETKKNKAKKITVVITYLIALLCLLAGLLAPLYQFGNEALANEELGVTGYMMIRHVPHMLNKVFMTEIVPAEIPWFTNAVAQNLDFFSSLVGILYTLLCVVALIMFIPVCVGNKNKRTSANCALVMEIIALVVLLSYIAYYAFFLVLLGVVAWTDYNILIAFGGTLIIAIVQSITTKGSIGVSKTAAILFSALAVIALVDITLFAPFLSDPLNSLSTAIGSGDRANFVGGLFGGVTGSDIGLFGIASLFNAGAIFEALSGATLLLVLYVLWMIVAILTVVNMVIDVIGLGTGKKFDEKGKPCKNSGSNIFALVRYILAFVLTVVIIILAIVTEGITAGVYLYLLAIVLFLEIMNAMGRTIAANKRAKKAAAGPAAPKAKAPEKAKKPEQAANPMDNPGFAAIFAQKPVEEPTPAPAPVAEQQPVQAEATVAEEPEQTEEKPAAEPAPTVYFYGGETDEFLETLSDSEKVEFVEVFVKRSQGKVSGVPQYIINEDNSDFFPTVFIYINRFRGMVSDGLMAKMYRQLGKSSM